ncbi:MAG: DUF5009 domain-containing protein [Bryobacteraceae bacterium]
MSAIAAPAPVSSVPNVPATAPARNSAIDVYRGFVMFLMMAEVLHLARVSRAVPDSWLWSALAYHQTHVDWAGCSLHDLIQPSFSFLVGVALPYSIASRMAKGKSFGPMLWHAIWRSQILIWLGVFLRSMSRLQTNFTFEDTLSQIGMGYPILFLLGFKPRRWHWIALAVILVGYWAAFALYPAPPADFNWGAVGVPADWQHHYTGLAAHWDKNSNMGAAFDRWFLNLFPRPKPFEFNGGGYLTLSFIPTLGTMILGLICGSWLRESAPAIPYRKFLIAGVALLAGGLFTHFTGLCPVVKRIWTPSWTLFSGGCCFLLTAAFHWICANATGAKAMFWLAVIGMNSIAAYLIAHLWDGFILQSFKIHLGQDVFKIFGAAYEPFLGGVGILAMFWLILYWMYQRKLFLRI